MSGAERLSPLSSPEVSVKLFAADPDAVRLGELVPAFHRWIREGLLDELQIDVASYEHVPKGPGVVLICDKAHYSLDLGKGRPGLRYRGRREARATGAGAIVDAFGRALRAARLLETDPELGGRYGFRTDEVEFGIYDRLRAPSEDRTLDAIRPDLEQAAKALWGADAVTLELVSGAREPFAVLVRTGVASRLEELESRVAEVGA